MKIEFNQEKNEFMVYCPFHMNSMAKAIPDRRWNKKLGCWLVPRLKQNVRFMRDNFKESFFDVNAMSALESYKEMTADLTSRFPPWYKSKTYDDMAHQKEAKNKMWGNNEFALLFSMGGGKTKVAIDWVTALRMDGQIDGVLVVVESSIKFVWEDEFDTHCPIESQFFVMEAGKDKKAIEWANKKHDYPVMVLGVESLSQGRAWEAMMHFVKTRRVAMIIDEATSIKNDTSARTQRCVAAGNEAKFRLIMTGTPITNGYEDLYSQFNFLNEDIIGFTSFYSFRNHYCVMGGFEDKKVIAYNNIDELIETIEPYSMRKTKEQMLDLPPKVYLPRIVQLNKAQREMYDSMKNNMIIEYGDGEELSVDMVLEQMLRLQQITGGFFAKEEGDTFTTHKIEGKNPKIEEIKKILGEIKGEKMIIWCRYRPEVDLVMEELRRAGVRAVCFHGGLDTDQKRAAVRGIQEGDEQAIVATMAMAKGQTLTKATYSLIFSNSFSLEMRMQLEDRNHRMGTEKVVQKNEKGEWQGHVTYIDLLADDTIDTKTIFPALVKKKVQADYFDDKIDPKTTLMRGKDFTSMI